MKHTDVPQELKDRACAMFSKDFRTSHTSVLEDLGIDPDPENKLIWGWLAEKEAMEEEAAKPTIIVKRRSENDYHASLKGNPAIWGSGKGYYSAIGNLLTAHTNIFGIKVEQE